MVPVWLAVSCQGRLPSGLGQLLRAQASAVPWCTAISGLPSATRGEQMESSEAKEALPQRLALAVDPLPVLSFKVGVAARCLLALLANGKLLTVSKKYTYVLRSS